MAEPFMGQFSLVAFNYPPAGWAFAAGQLLSVSQYAALFSDQLWRRWQKQFCAAQHAEQHRGRIWASLAP